MVPWVSVHKRPGRPGDGDYALVADENNGYGVSDEHEPSQEPSSGTGTLQPMTVVRYGRMGLVGEFTHPVRMRLPTCGRIVVQTDRGIEIGTQVHLTCSSCEKRISREQMYSYVERSGPEHLRPRAGRVLRTATDDDLADERHLRTDEQEKLKACAAFVEAHKLPMKLVDCEHLLGGERIIFYFMAEGRIDFRDLVRDLAREFQTRIEMRQVGARDEARLIADYETCGRECCCKNFLKTLKPITMKMAKMQKATLDPSKVSGRCGRLKCCLRYEHENYEELDKQLPRIGAWVRSTQGEGRVATRQILTQLVELLTEDGRRLIVPIEEVESVGQAPVKPEIPPDVAERRPAPGKVPADPPDNGGPATTAPASESDSPDGVEGESRRKRRRRGRRGRRGKARDGGTDEASASPGPGNGTAETD